MGTPLRRRLRLARRGVWYVIAITVVCMALVLGIVSQVLPLADQHPDKVAAWLSARAGRPVAFERLTTHWTRRGPLLQLDGLRIGPADTAVRIGQAEVLVSMYGGLLPGRSFTELRLRKLALTLQRADDGKWSVQGLPGEHAGGDPLKTLEGLGELQVIDGSLTVLAPSLGWNLKLPEIDLRLKVDGDRIRAGARTRIRPDAPPLQVSVDFNRRQGNGSAYADIRADDVGAWQSLLRYAGVQLSHGKGRLRGWVQLHANRVVMVSTDVQLEKLRLQGAPLAQGQPSPSVQFDRLGMRGRWRLVQGGWRFDAPLLRVTGPADVQKLDGLVFAMGQHNALLADQVDAAPLLSVLGLSDRLEVGLRRWLLQAKPYLKLDQLSLVAERGGAMQGKGHLTGLGFAPVGHSPGLSGLAGDFVGDSAGFELQLDPASTMRFDWPSGFGVVHNVNLTGKLIGWREGAGWRMATPDLQVKGKDYGAHARGSLWFQGDGTRPWLELAADLEDAPVVVAKGFWIHHSMPKAAVDWLNGALQGGSVRNGHALVTGDLDDWPFVDNNGRFEASAHIDSGEIKFQPDWPLMEQVNADVRFIGGGFSLNGDGELAGVKVKGLQAGIDQFSRSELKIDASADADAGRLLALLKQSPLHKRYGDTLDNLGAAGKAKVDFHLLQPLHAQAGSRKKLEGRVVLANARLSEKRWDLAFNSVSGEANYTEGGFSAEKLQVAYQGLPGELSLRAGTGTRDSEQVFESELAARLEVSSLLDHAAEMAWLKPYAEGRSDWNIGVNVGKAQGKQAALVKLHLSTDLVGTALTLPAPLNKPANTALATTVSTDLPMGSGHTDVVFGKLLALRAQSIGDQTSVRVALGTGVVPAALDVPGLVVSGRTRWLDALEWSALAGGGGNGKLSLRHVDVSAERLLLLGSTFPDTRVQLAPARNALAVTLEGKALEGALLIPDAKGSPIAGRLARVHWRKTDPGQFVASTSVTVRKNINPAAVPPLALDIDELKFADAALGSAHLRTRAIADGMQIEQLQLRAPKQKLDINGSWRGMGSTAQTRMNVQIDSQDFGSLLGALGYPGQLGDGEGSIGMDLGWTGAPSEFRLSSLQGQIDVAMRDGRLLEVNPGAGRVLGLLSVAEVRRRLSLDFSDFFFKGFAFNRLDGKLLLADGQARSDGLLIDGPAAEIRIRGNTDLRSERFDQTIEVLPKSANVLTAVGAVAGGPIGAAVGAVANAVLKKPLSEIGAKTYRVTGPWKDPQIQLIDRTESRATPSTAVPQRQP